MYQVYLPHAGQISSPLLQQSIAHFGAYRSSNTCKTPTSWYNNQTEMMPKTTHIVLLCTKLTFFKRYFYFSTPAAGLLPHSRPHGAQGVRVCNTAHTRAPAEIRGGRSGASKWRILANNYGESFRPARAKQDDGTPTILKIFVCCWLLAACAVSCLIPPSLELSTTRQPRNSSSRPIKLSFL